MKRRTLAWAAAVMLVVSATAATVVNAQTTRGSPARLSGDQRDFDIPAQSLAAALVQFSRQSGVQVITDGLELGNLHAQAVKGRFTTADAIAKMLANTGFKFEVTGPRTLVVVRQGERSSEVPASQVGDQKTSSAATRERSPVALEGIVVTGSRLARPSDGPAPVTIMNREEIDRLGVSNVADALKYLPQVSFFVPEWQAQGGARRVQLRGLAAGTTLILINGRRAVPGAIGSAGNYFDLNTIPLPAVERIEVLSDSASAVYGADAVAGVVNVVLKSSVERPIVDLYYGAADGGAEERRVSLTLGARRDRGRGLITFDYFERDPLFGAERDIVGDADYRRFGASDRRVLTANPGNICSASGANLPGLPAPCAAVPLGSSGVGLSPSSFAATAGQQNRETLARHRAFIPWSRRYSGSASGSFDLTDSISVFGELLYADRDDVLTTGPATVSQGAVPATNPFNPFGVPVVANFLLTGNNRTGPSDETSYRIAAGFKGAFRSWDWEFAGLASDSDGSFANVGNVDAARLRAALTSTSPATALNVFQHGPGGSEELLNSLVAVVPATVFSSKSHQVGAFVRGDIFQMPAGPLQVVTGAEWRYEAISAVSSISSINEDRANRESSAAYAELQLPVFGKAKALPLVQDLSLTLAGRYDRYSDFGSTFNAQYGLAWRPHSSVLVRASQAESFRAPGLTELYQPVTSVLQVTFLDPHRGGESTTAAHRFGGNPSLEPETAKSLSIGVVWTPVLAGRPRFSASYWRIEMDQRILTTVPILSLLRNESFFPGRVVRAAPTPADLAAGRPGRVTSIDTTLLNAGRLETSGVDLDLSADFSTAIGLLSPRINATRVQEYKSADFPITPFLERLGVADFNGTVPRWRVVASLGWSHGGWNLTAVTRYVGKYDDSTFNVRNGRKVAATTLVDLQASVELEKQGVFGRSALTKGTVLRVGAVNVFDKEPPFSDVFGFGYDPTVGDIRQRFVYVSISKAF